MKRTKRYMLEICSALISRFSIQLNVKLCWCLARQGRGFLDEVGADNVSNSFFVRHTCSSFTRRERDYVFKNLPSVYLPVCINVVEEVNKIQEEKTRSLTFSLIRLSVCIIDHSLVCKILVFSARINVCDPIKVVFHSVFFVFVCCFACAVRSQQEEASRTVIHERRNKGDLIHRN